MVYEPEAGLHQTGALFPAKALILDFPASKAVKVNVGCVATQLMMFSYSSLNRL